MIDEKDRADVATLLAWWRELGVEGAASETATDWLAHGDTPPGAGFAMADVATETAVASPGDRLAAPAAPAMMRAPQQSPSGRVSVVPSRPPLVSEPPRRFATPPPDAAALAAREAARSAPTLDALREVLEHFDGCALKATAKSLCFYRGRADARLMIVGEAPGRDEDLEGRPFVGRAGQLLDKMLAAIGLKEADVHITNIVYWRPPGNRTPTPQEALACRPFLERQMELVDPEIVVLLGGAAAKEVLATAEGIMRLRGKWRTLDLAGRERRAIATLHPAYLLRTPAAKQLAWHDLLQIKAAFHSSAK